MPRTGYEHVSIDERTMREESIRIPLVARYPELIRQPRLVSEQVLNIDVAPSILDICGLDPPPRAHGRSFRRLAQGDNTGWRKCWHAEGRAAVVVGGDRRPARPHAGQPAAQDGVARAVDPVSIEEPLPVVAARN
ncbi:MAG: sulfatase/phosphatase domain-containing protein [Acidobacteriota bacterium]